MPKVTKVNNKLVKTSGKAKTKLRWWHAAIAIAAVAVVGIVVVRLSSASNHVFTFQPAQMSGGTLKSKTDGTKARLVTAGQTTSVTITDAQVKSINILCANLAYGATGTKAILTYTPTQGGTYTEFGMHQDLDLTGDSGTTDSCLDGTVNGGFKLPTNSTGIVSLKVTSGQVVLYSIYGSKDFVVTFADQAIRFDASLGAITRSLVTGNATTNYSKLSSTTLAAAELEQYPKAKGQCDQFSNPLGIVGVDTSATAKPGYKLIKKLKSGKYLYYADNGKQSTCYTARPKLNAMQNTQIQMVLSALKEAK